MNTPCGRAQILCRFDLVFVERINRVIDWENHEEHVGVDHYGEHGAIGGNKAEAFASFHVDDAQQVQQTVEHALLFQDHDPREDAQQLVDCVGDQKAKHQDCKLVTVRGHRNGVGHWIAQCKRQNSDAERVDDGGKEDLEMHRTHHSEVLERIRGIQTDSVCRGFLSYFQRSNLGF